MTKLQHFYTARFLHDQPSTTTTTTWTTSRNTEHETTTWPIFNISNNKILHDQKHFLLLHDQTSTFLNNKTTTWPTTWLQHFLQQDYYMTNLQHFLTTNYYMTNCQHFLTTKLLHDQPSTFLTANYYMTNLQHFLTTKLLHEPTSRNSEQQTTTWPIFNIS